MVFALTIPTRAPNAQAAKDFVRFLLSPAGVDSGLSGQTALQRHGR
jgi:ABC-type molybdate transport system substrate-binding protein